jgi:hypothetical protein
LDAVSERTVRLACVFEITRGFGLWFDLSLGFVLVVAVFVVEHGEEFV